MSPQDKALERIITELTHALAYTHDPRFAKLQQQAVKMRSPEQVAKMEREKGLR